MREEVHVDAPNEYKFEEMKDLNHISQHVHHKLKVDHIYLVLVIVC